MDYDFQFTWRQIEEPTGFNKFETFVGHGRGINGYLVSHRPIGVIQGLLNRYMLELFNR